MWMAAGWVYLLIGVLDVPIRRKLAEGTYIANRSVGRSRHRKGIERYGAGSTDIDRTPQRRRQWRLGNALCRPNPRSLLLLGCAPFVPPLVFQSAERNESPS